MTEQKSSKNIFQQALNAVSNRDEKAAIEAAMKKMDELENQLTLTQSKLADAEKKASDTALKATAAERKTAELQAALDKSQAEVATVKRLQGEAEARVNQAEMRIRTLSNELQTIQADQMKSAQASAASSAATEAAKKAIMTEHTLKADETLSHLALKYYGSAYEPYWRVIYEANKVLIGPNPARVRPGMVIKIPVKPENLK